MTTVRVINTGAGWATPPCKCGGKWLQKSRQLRRFRGHRRMTVRCERCDRRGVLQLELETPCVVCHDNHGETEIRGKRYCTEHAARQLFSAIGELADEKKDDDAKRPVPKMPV